MFLSWRNRFTRTSNKHNCKNLIRVCQCQSWHRQCGMPGQSSQCRPLSATYARATKNSKQSHEWYWRRTEKKNNFVMQDICKLPSLPRFALRWNDMKFHTRLDSHIRLWHQFPILLLQKTRIPGLCAEISAGNGEKWPTISFTETQVGKATPSHWHRVVQSCSETWN